MRRGYLLIFCTLIFSSCNNSTTKPYVPKEKEGLKLLWSDEFDTDGLPNSLNWTYDVGDACNLPMGCGWGNNELQHYTNANLENARVEDGILIIEAHKKKTGNRAYSSARLVSKQRQEFLYGRFEIRARVPSGLGTWSAIWMLPTDKTYGGWPTSGEIDIMEHVGYEPKVIFGTPHTGAYNGMIGTQRGGEVKIPDAETEFHVYRVDWSEDRIDWFVDDAHYHTFEKTSDDIKKWPFDKPFHFLMNLAVGGNWGGAKGVAEDIWPRRMEVDYVRVWQ